MDSLLKNEQKTWGLEELDALSSLVAAMHPCPEFIVGSTWMQDVLHRVCNRATDILRKVCVLACYSTTNIRNLTTY
jgi:hypothetical protein